VSGEQLKSRKTLVRKSAIRIAISAMLLIGSFQAEAQPPRTVRMGYLGSSSGLTAGEKDFIEELRKHGWIEGQNLVIERRYWENHLDRLRQPLRPSLLSWLVPPMQ
jgi:hypothetical protein